MAFQIATQTTDLDRTDNINEVRALAGRHSARNPDLAAMDLPSLVERAQWGGHAAALELVTRHEPMIRKLISRASVGSAAKTDLQQAAMEGFLASLKSYDASKGTAVFTHAHTYVIAALREANRESAPRPAASRNQAYYWAAMDACDRDAVKARAYCRLQRLSINDLEFFAEEGDTLAREILDKRIDQFDALVRRDADDAPEWDEYAARPGRGLDGPAFDSIHATVAYLDASADLGDGEGDTGHDTTGDPNAVDAFASVIERMALGQLLAALHGRDRDVMMRHLHGDTDRDIADALGLSRTRVVNLRAAIVRRFRKLSA